jgi:hypothetical protein
MLDLSGLLLRGMTSAEAALSCSSASQSRLTKLFEKD